MLFSVSRVSRIEYQNNIKIHNLSFHTQITVIHKLVNYTQWQDGIEL